MNRKFYSSTKLNELEARMHSDETAFKMQTLVPELRELTQKTAKAQSLYGCNDENISSLGIPVGTSNDPTMFRHIQIRVGGCDARVNRKRNHEKTTAR